MRNLLKDIHIADKHYVFDGNNFDIFLIDNEDEYTQYKKDEDAENIVALWDKTFISKVVLNVSNKCNLRCRYCYADGGNYGRCEAVMTEETLFNIISDLKNKGIMHIGILSLFGGEPLLNPTFIVAATELFSKNFEIDNYEIVTNGTLLTTNMAHFLQSHNVRLVISCDGPEDITDRLRGKGTYRKAMNSLEMCKRMDYPNLYVSATYTKLHKEMGYSYRDICMYFENLGYEASVSTVLSSDEFLVIREPMSQSEFAEDVKNSLNHILHNDLRGTINPYVHAVCLSLFCKTRSEHFCDDLLSSRSICYDYNGEKYNCFRLWNDAQYALQNNEETSIKLEKVNCKDNVSLCKACWAKYMCKTCIVAVLQNAISFPAQNNTCSDQIAYEIVIHEIIKLVNEGYSELLAENYLNNFLIYK